MTQASDALAAQISTTIQVQDSAAAPIAALQSQIASLKQQLASATDDSAQLDGIRLQLKTSTDKLAALLAAAAA